MALLVPTNSGTVHRRLGPSETFDVLGPIPARRFIDLMFIHLRFLGQLSAPGPMLLGVTVGASSQASAGAFAAGTSLIQRSVVTIQGHPAIRFQFDTAPESVNFTLAIGRQVLAGSTFVHIASTASADGEADLTVSLRLLGLVLETRERLGQLEAVSLP